MKKPNYMLVIVSGMFITMSLATRRTAGILFAVAAMIYDIIYIIQFIRNKRN